MNRSGNSFLVELDGIITLLISSFSLYRSVVCPDGRENSTMVLAGDSGRTNRMHFCNEKVKARDYNYEVPKRLKKKKKGALRLLTQDRSRRIEIT
jgi:hypothetical protein